MGTRPSKAAPAVGERFQVEILKMAIGGAGIARHDGLVIFVPDSAPGDSLEVEVTRVHSNHAEARLLKVLNPGPGRREPPCRYAHECGGCSWQQMSTATQLEQK